jgi:hypothetical protein
VSVTTAARITNFGPMLGLTFDDQRRIWMERGAAEYVRIHLVPAMPPKTAGVATGCWVWVGPMTTDGRPYGVWKNETLNVRRLLYELKEGPLDARQHLTPLCQLGRCCNPDHMETMARGPVPKPPLTPKQANAYDRCAYGHVMSPSNVYEQRGRRYCRACRAQNSRRYRQALAAGEKKNRPR